ncbi:MAG: CoA transferase [bacterium]|nr:CoA transferase [bacterium]
MTPPGLTGIRVVCLAINLPGPLAAMRLASLGASVTKVEPPTGDPVELVSAQWYAQITAELRVVRLDLKSPDGRVALTELLDEADVLLTSFRPSALDRLGLDWPALSARHPRISQVAIVGYPGADAERPGHDLTYQADSGLLTGDAMPRAQFADLAGAERAVTQTLAAVIAQRLHGQRTYAEVSLAAVASELGQSARLGLSGPSGVLGGALPTYAIYATANGHIALAALEQNFQSRLASLLGVELTHSELAAQFVLRTSTWWSTWAQDNDIPLAVIA